MEKFFTLLTQNRIRYHPEVSFLEFVEVEFVGEKLMAGGRAFSDEEADHLDYLMVKAGDLFDDLGIDIFEYSMVIDDRVRGRLISY